ncbi:ribonuclease P protein component [Ferruginibacter yonginensis]|uniref:Ribonuclease P protein component n=1 Tax=Ferruginibacter yonginensis TaxID=1310416 RepID=A0ABV8QSW6_9BACT
MSTSNGSDVTSTTRYFLGKDDRLKSRKAIDVLFKQGKSFSHFPLRVFFYKSVSGSGLKAGFSASTRNFKKATDRNRVKRLLRETYRLQKNIIEKEVDTTTQSITILFVYIHKEVPQYEVLYAKMSTALLRIVKQLHENNQ